MHGYLMLCDFAETINGKLYIQGGGWTRLAAGGVPTTMYLAGKILVPWNQTNRANTIDLDLFTGDGRPVLGPDGSPLHLGGNFEVGRPPGVAAGSEIDFPVSFKVEGMPLDVGRYMWTLKVSGAQIAEVPFDVVAPR
jgi:hypothetical protein